MFSEEEVDRSSFTLFWFRPSTGNNPGSFSNCVSIIRTCEDRGKDPASLIAPQANLESYRQQGRRRFTAGMKDTKMLSCLIPMMRNSL